MDTFSIKCVDQNKKEIGQQTVTLSTEEADAHQIIMSDKNGTALISIDTTASQLVLDNSSGLFDAITTEKPVAKISISNIKMDYNENLTFSVDDSKTTYTITGKEITSKTRGKAEQVVAKFDVPLDVTLPSTLFQDIENKNLQVDGFPFQMFSALSKETQEKFGITCYESKSKLLHIVKFNEQLYIGRGQKLVPVNIANQNLYKMGDSSVLGFTMGKKNGISGKQSSGIAFAMDEQELEEVAKFINGEDLSKSTFKTMQEFESNDIDYVKVIKQSDLTKAFKDAEDGLGISASADEQTQDEPKEDNPDEGNNPQKPIQDNPDNPQPAQNGESGGGNPANGSTEKPKTEEKPKEPKPADKKPMPPKEKAVVDVAGISGILAACLGALMISGVFVSVFALILFSFLAVVCLGTSASFAIQYSKREKPSKEEKLKNKISKKEAQLARLAEKEPTPRNERKKNRLKNSIERLNNKLDKEMGIKSEKEEPSKTSDKQEPVDNQQEQKSQEDIATEQEIKNENEEQIEGEMSTSPEDLPTKTPATPVTEESMITSCKEINEYLAKTIDNPPAENDSYEKFIGEVDKMVSSVCADGVDVSSVPEDAKDVYQQYINYRTAYISYQASYEKMQNANQTISEDLPEVQGEYSAQRDVLTKQLFDLYMATQQYIKDRTSIIPVEQATNESNSSQSDEERQA